MKITTKILLIMSLVYIVAVIYRKQSEEYSQEGFTQQSNFSMKDNKTLYDDFYCEIYDEIMYDPNKVEHEADEIIRTTKMNKDSTILDVGSGCGHHVNEFQERGYKINGLDNSKDMIRYAKKKYPKSYFKQGSILNPYIFDDKTYSHILSLYFTIYYFRDKTKFFGICSKLLKPGGYLVIHLVDKELFDPIVSPANPLVLMSPQREAKNRILTSSVKFKDFQYKSKFNINSDIGIFEENFIDDKTKKIRKNVHTLFMDSQKEIIKKANERGFVLEGRIDLTPIQYEYQYLYILSKTL